MKRFYVNTAALCLLLLSVSACSMNGETETPDAPELLSLEVASETEINFEFSVPVSVLSLYFAPSLEIMSIDDGNTVRVHLEQNLEPGMRVVANIRVRDSHGNTLDESVPFKKEAPPGTESPGTESPGTEFPGTETPGTEEPSYGPVVNPGGNSGGPDLVINEVRTEWEGNAGNRVEFVEFRVLSPGNLEGLRVYIHRRSGSRTPSPFVFPYARVEAGEFVVLFLRTLERPLGDLYAAAHNFQIPGSSALLNRTGVVYVQDRDDRVLSAVMLYENTSRSWQESQVPHFAELAGFLFEHGAWKSPGGGIASPADAIPSSRTTLTRTISRDETMPNTGTAADWYTTVTHGASPGRPNDERRLQ